MSLSKSVDPYLKDAGIAIPAEDEKYNPHHSPTTGEFSSGGGMSRKMVTSEEVGGVLTAAGIPKAKQEKPGRRFSERVTGEGFVAIQSTSKGKPAGPVLLKWKVTTADAKQKGVAWEEKQIQHNSEKMVTVLKAKGYNVYLGQGAVLVREN